jgi:hypothetical protein
MRKIFLASSLLAALICILGMSYIQWLRHKEETPPQIGSLWVWTPQNPYSNLQPDTVQVLDTKQGYVQFYSTSRNDTDSEPIRFFNVVYKKISD